VPGNAEVVERLADAFERGDMEDSLACLDPEIELHPIRARLEGTSYVGHEGWRRMVADWDSDWEGLRLEQRTLHEQGNVVVAVGRFIARGRTSGVELDVPIGLVYRLREGKIARVDSFTDPNQALRAAGIEQ
jgi:ketosteroid isomerase-like protein